MLGPLGRRLFAAFALVGIGAVGLLAGLAVYSVTSHTGALVNEQRDQARGQIVASLSDAYASAGSWSKADLSAARALAQADGATLVIVDTSGGQVATISPSPMMDHHMGATQGHDGEPSATAPMGHHGETGPGMGMEAAVLATATAPAAPTPSASPSATSMTTSMTAQGAAIVVDGSTVGSVLITFPAAGQSAAEQAGRAILQNLAIGAAVAVLLAAIAALIASRRTAAPLTALAEAAGAIERGEPDATARLRPGPGEIGQVAQAFTRMAATLEREDALRRAMVADVAHELRTPVTILLGASEQMLDGLAEPDTAALSSLHDEILRLDRLLDDLSALAAAQAAGLELTRTSTDLATAAQRTCRALGASFEEAGLHLVTHLEAAKVYADEDRLVQVATNLLTNALKFTPSGGDVTVTTRTVTDLSDTPVAELIVTDTGPGIPEADLPHVFQRFWRGASAPRRSGTGIGLAVVDELVTAHGGTVHAETPSGTGARFTVRLPAR
jgi:two-component system sensor histidine kinase BaeS